MIKCFFSFLVLSSIVCNVLYAQVTGLQFKPLHQLAGSWEMNTSKGSLIEVWKIQDDSTLVSESFRINGTDTIPQETVVLSLRNNSINFTSTVADQNNQQPVSFILIKIQDGKYVFENKAHDFPQQIFYTLAGNNSLLAGISGRINDTYKEILFNFTRQKQ